MPFINNYTKAIVSSLVTSILALYQVQLLNSVLHFSWHLLIKGESSRIRVTTFTFAH
jgi:hypothetical protein